MKYEYKTTTIENKSRLMRAEANTSQITEVLNTNGQLGWELVTITPITGSYGFAYSLLLTFKRPLS